MATSTATVIAETFGLDVSDVRDYRYQATRTKRPIFAIGDRYYTTGGTPPKDEVGGAWVAHSDQFFARRGGTTLWVSTAR